MLVWHRGAGKTAWAIPELVHEALRATPIPEDPRRYAYIAPLRVQAQDVVWDRLLAYTRPLPGCIPNKAELRVELPGGALIQLYGADNPDRMRGITLDGCVRDEMAQQPPSLFREVLLPALNRAGRPGWDVAIGTPKGRNAFWETYDNAKQQMAAGNADYFADVQPVSVTQGIPEDQLIDARRQMTDAEYEQEFECSFQAAIVGAYYGAEMQRMEALGRIRPVPYDARLPCTTAWDLGIGDDTVVLVAQRVGGETRIVDCIHNNGVALDWYVSEIARRGYNPTETILPHDAAARELIAGRSRVETLRSLGMPRCRVLPASSVEDGINAARLLLPGCVVDTERCARFLEALRQYRRDWDDRGQAFRPRPRHDWTSHFADALRVLAVGWREHAAPIRLPMHAGAWDPYDAPKPRFLMPASAPAWSPFGDAA